MKKKLIALLLVLALPLSFAACAPKSAPAAEKPAEEAPAAETAAETSAAPTAEEVRGVTIPEFSLSVNGVTITQAEMAAYPMYSVQAFSINSSGTESTNTFIGFALKDVCDAAGLKENYIWAMATADDGYEVEYTGDVVMADTTLVAMSSNGEPFSSAPWFAPCSSQTTGDYLKGCVSILVNTKEEKPEVAAVPAEAEGGEAAAGELPEISDKTDKVVFNAFSFKVNGEEVTNDKLEGLSIYKISPTTVNSKGTASENTYTGYKLQDVLKACGIEAPASVKAIANDGYESELAADLITSDYTLIAIEKDKEVGEGGTIWLAPCSEGESSAYCKLVVEIEAK